MRAHLRLSHCGIAAICICLAALTFITYLQFGATDEIDRQEANAAYSAFIRHVLEDSRKRSALIPSWSKFPGSEKGLFSDDLYAVLNMPELPWNERLWLRLRWRMIKQLYENNRRGERVVLESTSDYRLVEPEEMFEIFGKHGSGGWWIVRKQIPQAYGFIEFSKPAFNKSKTELLFYSRRMCGGTCGVSSYVLMKKQQGQWRFDRELKVANY